MALTVYIGQTETWSSCFVKLIQFSLLLIETDHPGRQWVILGQLAL
jgi:hypothetical protein